MGRIHVTFTILRSFMLQLLKECDEYLSRALQDSWRQEQKEK